MKKITHRAPRHAASVEVAVDSRRFLVPLAAVIIAIAMVATGIGTAFALAYKTADVTFDGKTRTISSWGATVSDLLKDNAITLDDKDKVTPGLSTELKTGMDIEILSSREVTVILNGQEITVDTTELSAAAAIKNNWPDQSVLFKNTFGKDHYGVELPLFASGDEFQLVHDGVTDLAKAQKGEVAEDILERVNLKMGDKDLLNITFNPGALPIMQVQRVTEEDVTSQEVIPFETETTNDANKYQDEKTVTQAGVNGLKEIVKTIRKVDGQIQSENVKSENVITQPVTKKVTVGTKARPAGAAIAATGDVWSKLAFCESGGRPGTNTGNGFYGMYQFTLSTWRSVGGTGLPSDASAEEQTKRAQILQARAGWGQWPACSRKLGLR
ncbi:MAG: transglycosylase family protein [Mobiluncus sp.]|uniref:resuscitation-promoting factor n=1 Tax=Mobiluncus sp. TaxID=47293 RepID=UPI00258DD64C|nr:resuscitation-promoting factor [Mobiluncus sp.]MCI6584784.1 transglycosylase family protein [Mobiluncus sp.]